MDFPANCQWTKGWVQLSGLYLETKNMRNTLLTPGDTEISAFYDDTPGIAFGGTKDSELELSSKCKCVTASKKNTQLEDEFANLYSILARMTDSSSSLWVPQSHSPLEDNYSTFYLQT